MKIFSTPVAVETLIALPQDDLTIVLSRLRIFYGKTKRDELSEQDWLVLTAQFSRTGISFNRLDNETFSLGRMSAKFLHPRIHISESSSFDSNVFWSLPTRGLSL